MCFRIRKSVRYIWDTPNGVDAIITRNAKDFERQDIPVMTPGEFLDTF